MIFKKKEKKKEQTSSEIDAKFEIRLRALEEETHQLISDHNFGRITDEEFESHRADIGERIEKFKVDYNNRYLDELMGHPMQTLDDIFGRVKNESLDKG